MKRIKMLKGMIGLAVVLLVLCLCTVAGADEDEEKIDYSIEIDGIKYNLYDKDNKAEVVNNNYSGNISIPANVTYNDKTYSVTSIGLSAFSSSGLTSVTIPGSVTSIGQQAFSCCHGLTSITIPDGVTSIGLSAFSSSGLTSVTIPGSVTSIGQQAFSECDGLTSVTICEGQENLVIGDVAFFHCSNLQSVTIPGRVTQINTHAFNYCESLESITIPCNFDKSKFGSNTGIYVAGDNFTVGSSNGTFTYIHNCSSSLDYEGTSVTATCSNQGCFLTDNKATLTIVKPTLKTYGQTGEGISAEATLTGLADFNAVTGKTIAATDIRYMDVQKPTSMSSSPRTDVGKYYALIAVDTNKSIYVEYEITKATPTMSGDLSTAATYGDTMGAVKNWLNNQEPDGVNSQSLNGTWAWKDTNITETTSVGNAGTTYSFQATFTPSDSTLYESITKEIKVTVNPKSLAKLKEGSTTEYTTEPAEGITVSLNNTSFSYSGTFPQLIVTVKDGETTLEKGENKDYAINYKVKNGDYYTDTDTIQNAGNYKVVITGKGNYTGTVEKEMEITPKALTVTAKAKTITYGEAPTNGGVTYDGFENNETENVLGGTLTYAYDYTQYDGIGDYKIIPDGLTSNNYAITFESGMLTVEQKEVGLSWTDGALIYNGKKQAPTVTATGLVNSDEISVTVTGGQKDIGNGLTATATGLTGTKADNYKLPDANTTTFSIEPKSITGAPVTLDKTQLTYNGTEQSVKVNGVVIDGLTLTADDYTVSGNTGTNMGDYTVKVTGVGNFCGTATEKWSIVEKAMTVTAENVNAEYDGQPHGIIVTVTEPASGATVKYGTSAGTCNLDASPTITNAGTLTVYYLVTAVNYKDYTGTAIVTVAKTDTAVETPPAAVPDLTWNGGQSPLVTGGTASGTMEYALGTDATTPPTSGWSTDIPTAANAGIYYVWCRSAGDADHNSSEPVCVVVEIAKGDPVIETVPAAVLSLVWTGEPIPLISVGTVTGGEVQYVIGAYTKASAAPTTGWSKEIPMATAPGTYEVWYRVVGDANHLDTEPVCLTVTVAGSSEPTPTDAPELTPTDVSEPTPTDAPEPTPTNAPEPTPTDAPEPTPTPTPRPAPCGNLRPVLKSAGAKSLKLSWTKMKNVDGYDVFMTRCFTENYKLVKSVSAKKDSCRIDGLKKGVAYKMYIRPYVLQSDGTKKYASKSMVVHSYTNHGNGKETNPKDIRLKTKELTVSVGGKADISAELIGEVSGLRVLDHFGALTYESGNEKIATVTEEGKVTGKAEGTCKIRVIACNGVSRSVTVTVAPKLTGISFPKKEYSLKKGKTLDLAAKLKRTPAGATAKFTWESSDEEVATVSKDGVVTALKKGTATITVTTKSGLKAKVKIRVKGK